MDPIHGKLSFDVTHSVASLILRHGDECDERRKIIVKLSDVAASGYRKVSSARHVCEEHRPGKSRYADDKATGANVSE